MTEEEMKAYFEKKEVVSYDNTNEKSKGLPDGVRVEYVKDHEKVDEGHYRQRSHIDIYKNDKLIKSIKLSLDPYAMFHGPYVLVSSDGQFDVFNTATEKSYSQELHIVPFFFDVEDTDEYEGKHYRLLVKGEGCYWGFESLTVHFEIELSQSDSANYDLMLWSFKQWEDNDEQEKNKEQTNKDQSESEKNID